MPTSPLISIIIPVYNLEKDISKTLDSVLFQSYSNLQIIIVNDGSTDNSLKICQQYAEKDTRIFLINKRNEGLPMARKSGLDIATGEYIHHLDGGDYIDKDMYQILVAELNKNNFPDIVIFGFYYTLYDKTEKSHSYPSQIPSPLEILKHMWSTQEYNAVWQYISKRVLSDKIAFNPKLNIGEDTWYTSQVIYNATTLTFIDEHLYYYVINESSMTRSSLSEKNIQSILLVPDLIEKYMRDKPQYLEVEKELLALKLQAYATILLGGRLEYMSKFVPEFNEAFKKYPQLEYTGVTKRVKKIIKLYTKNRFLYHIKIKYYRIKGKIR